MNTINISVIIPVYNNGETIIETLNSIINQTLKNFEIIIVNDGSTDHSIDNINSFIDNNPNYKINLITQENGGPSKARNNGVKNANGDFIVFIDGDDKFHPTYLEKAFKEINKNNRCLVYSNTTFFGAEEGRWNLAEYSVQNILKNNCIPIFAIHKKEDFLKAGMFDENLWFGEDWDLWISIIEKTKGDVYKIPEDLFFYRKRHDKSSLSDNMNHNNTADKARLYIFNKHYDFYFKNSLSLTDLINYTNEYIRYKKKYESIWYKRLFKKIKNKNG